MHRAIDRVYCVAEWILSFLHGIHGQTWGMRPRNETGWAPGLSARLSCSPGPRPDQFPAGAWSHVITRRKGECCALLIGVCSQWSTLRPASPKRPGPLSVCSGGAGGTISDGTSQYGLASARDRLAPATDESRSPATPVIESFRSAPNCSWEALIPFRILRANQTPAIRNRS